jgi:hypothetical protein
LLSFFIILFLCLNCPNVIGKCTTSGIDCSGLLPANRTYEITCFEKSRVVKIKTCLCCGYYIVTLDDKEIPFWLEEDGENIHIIIDNEDATNETCFAFFIHGNAVTCFHPCKKDTLSRKARKKYRIFDHAFLGGGVLLPIAPSKIPIKNSCSIQ